MGRKISTYIFTIVFGILIIGLGVKNAKTIYPQFVEIWKQNDITIQEKTRQMEEQYRTGFYKHNDWIELYGSFQKGMDRRIQGNMEYVLSEDGLLVKVAGEREVEPFANELVAFKQQLDQKQIPLLYVQMPARVPKDSQAAPETLTRINTYYEEIRNITDPAGIRCLDEQKLKERNAYESITDIYFKTDVHPSTNGEIIMANEIAKELNAIFGTTYFEQLIQVDDPRFQKISHPFLGNFAFSIGTKYIGADTFEEYIPKEPTSFRVRDVGGNWIKEGSFDEVVMNGITSTPEEELYTYWIVNYMNFTQPAYHVENLNKPEGPNLMVVCDSCCYRTLSYLALECNTITIIDPRYIPVGGPEYIEMAMAEKEYDAVIYLHGTFTTTNYSMFGDWSLE